MRDSRLLDGIDAMLVACTRVVEGHEAEPTADIIAYRYVKDTGADWPRGYVPGRR